MRVRRKLAGWDDSFLKKLIGAIPKVQLHATVMDCPVLYLYFASIFKYEALMEAIIDMPRLKPPRFIEAVCSLAGAAGRALAKTWADDRLKGEHNKAKTNVRLRNRASATGRQNLRQAVANYFTALNEIMCLVPEIMAELAIPPQNAAHVQAALLYCTGLRKTLFLVDDMILTTKRSKTLNNNQFKTLREIKKNLTRYIREAEEKVFQTVDKPSSSFVLKHAIGSVELDTPLRIFVEDDDSGKHVSCLEFPMLYGFGETELEAMAMLDREIVSLCQDVDEFLDLPDEYKYAAKLADLAVKNAK